MPQKEASTIQKGKEWGLQGCPVAEKGQRGPALAPTPIATDLGVLHLPSALSKAMPWGGVPWLGKPIAPSVLGLRGGPFPLVTIPPPHPSHHLLPGSPDPGTPTSPSPSWCHRHHCASSANSLGPGDKVNCPASSPTLLWAEHLLQASMAHKRQGQTQGCRALGTPAWTKREF